MKLCCVCHYEAPRHDATCSRCGEASWGPVFEKLAAPPAESVESEAVPAEVIDPVIVGDEVPQGALEPVHESVLPEDAVVAPDAPRKRGRR